MTRTKTFIEKNKTQDTYLYINTGEKGGIMRERYDELQQYIRQNKLGNMTYVS